MTSRNRAPVLGADRLVGERLDVAPDRGERRPQLVRDVGHEVAAHLVGAPQVGDVVEHQHGAVGRRAPTRGARGPPRGARRLRPA